MKKTITLYSKRQQSSSPLVHLFQSPTPTPGPLPRYLATCACDCLIWTESWSSIALPAARFTIISFSDAERPCSLRSASRMRGSSRTLRARLCAAASEPGSPDDLGRNAGTVLALVLVLRLGAVLLSSLLAKEAADAVEEDDVDGETFVKAVRLIRIILEGFGIPIAAAVGADRRATCTLGPDDDDDDDNDSDDEDDEGVVLMVVELADTRGLPRNNGCCCSFCC